VVIKRCVDENQAAIEVYFNQRVKKLGGNFPEFLGESRRAGDGDAGRQLVWRLLAPLLPLFEDLDPS
jgi:hypothetical protein